MDKEALKEKLKSIEDLEVKLDQPLKKYTTFKVGGPSDIFLIPSTPQALQKILSVINNINIPLFILGKGSNIIVSDKGFRGIVIYTGQLDNIQAVDTQLIAQTGATLEELADKALEVGLSGLEFASGIPGSLGGGLYMNAGAYGGEIKNVIEEVTCFNYQGKKITLSREELDLSYRSSVLQDKNLVAAKAKFELTEEKPEKIKTKMNELNDKRWAKQPMEMPSAGSIFKRPENHYPGALVEEAGLKGTKIGGAQVSEKHAGFIVNLGSATAQDIKQLIEKVQQKVYEHSGVKLKTEPKFIGDFED
jgi:UDP-N-acetylmuramate dehydrogenase